jgi:hypothetical protein
MGFDDPAYLGDETLEGSGERNYKLRANHLWNSTLGGGLGDQLRTEGDAAGLLKRIRDILKSLNLLAVQELIAFTDALKDADAVLRYASALFEYLRAPTIDEASFTPYLEAVEALPRPGKFKVVTWPVLTLLPFIARPTDHMFFKPSVTQVAAAAIGFDLQYRPEPNWLTYKRLIQMSERLMTVLRPHGARDLIDVQSFIWVAAGSA